MKLLKYVIIDICKPCRRFNKGQCLGPLTGWSSNVHEVTISLHDMESTWHGILHVIVDTVYSIDILPSSHPWSMIFGSLTTWRNSSTKNKQRLVTEKKTCKSWNKPGNLIWWTWLIGEKNLHDLLTIHLLIPSKIVKWQVLASQSLYDFLTI